MVPREQMIEPARKLRDTYAITPGIPLYKREFGFYSLDAWREQGMPQHHTLSTSSTRLLARDSRTARKSGRAKEGPTSSVATR